MSTNKNLFKEAIADAKAVREAALKNAKAVLEEALTPQLQSMYDTKLQEMEDEELEETFTSAHAENDGDNLDYNLEEEYEEEGLEEDFDLSEILAELDAEEMEEAKKKKKVMGSKAAEKSDKETYPGSKDEPYSGLDEAKEDGEEKEVGEMSVEDLKDLIKSIIDQEMEAEEEETPADEAGEKSDEEDNDASGDDEINLDELLAELDALNEEEELEEVMIPIKKINSKFSGALKGLKGYSTAKGINKYGMEKGTKNGAQPVKEADDKEEMEEALSTINILRKELNEVNLLNAKLLYVNKIFKAKNLSEAQKLKVIAHFDKATNIREAKMVYESLNSALKAPAKRTIKESLGFASKAAGMAPNRTIVESNDVISRMQKLANIIK
jgi:hypothetical protein